MAYNPSIQRYRNWYGRLLRFYPKPYRERFGDGMEQTFGDLLRERGDGKGFLGYALWISMETCGGIIRENITYILMNNTTKRLLIWAGVIVLLLLIPLALTIRDGNVPDVGWNWSAFDFVFMFVLLFGAGLVYELVARKMPKGVYRIAVGIAVIASVVLVWVNGAAGIIGNENNPANRLYLVVVLVGLVGIALARLRPFGMAWTAFVMAGVQFLIPIVALIFWDADFAPGVVHVFMLNAVFVAMYVVSGVLFRQVAR